MSWGAAFPDQGPPPTTPQATGGREERAHKHRSMDTCMPTHACTQMHAHTCLHTHACTNACPLRRGARGAPNPHMHAHMLTHMQAQVHAQMHSSMHPPTTTHHKPQGGGW